MPEHKGFDPSSKKLNKIRKEGQVCKSQLAASATIFTIIFLCIFNNLQFMWSNSTQMLEYCFSGSSDLMHSCSLDLLTDLLKSASRLLVFAFASASVCAFFVEIFQVGLIFNLAQLIPDTDKLNLLKGFRRQLEGIKKIPLILFKLILIIFLFCYLSSESLQIAKLLVLNSFGTHSLKAVFGLQKWIYAVSLLLAVFAICEYLFKRRQFINSHSMTFDELKKEIREEQGDPFQRAMRKSQHEALIMQEIVKRVRASKVIIVDD